MNQKHFDYHCLLLLCLVLLIWSGDGKSKNILWGCPVNECGIPQLKKN